MLGDFDSALISGSTSARKESLDEILANLKQLSSGSANDSEIRELLFKAYLKVGEVQGSMFHSNLGDAAGAKASYRHAEALARTPAEIAQAAIGLGDSAYYSGDHRAALVHYQKAGQVLEQAVQVNPLVEKQLLELAGLWYKIGFIQRETSLPQALESYQHELEIAQRTSRGFPLSVDVRRALALAEEHVGTVLEDAPSALLHLQRALEVYRELLKLDPESAELRNDVGVGLLRTANKKTELGDLRHAEEDYRDSLGFMEALVTSDPRNEEYQRIRNSLLHAFADCLYRLGKEAESRHLTVHALLVLQPLVTKPAPSYYDLWQYCWDLLTTPFQDLHRPREALESARKAAVATNHTDPGILNVLALAWKENRNLDKAIATEEEALKLYPASERAKPGSKQKEIEDNLARFNKEAAGQKNENQTARRQ